MNLYIFVLSIFVFNILVVTFTLFLWWHTKEIKQIDIIRIKYGALGILVEGVLLFFKYELINISNKFSEVVFVYMGITASEFFLIIFILIIIIAIIKAFKR
ncbi:hypothetical protein ACQRXC_29340 (plasmid) [Niallia taxi]|uniref:hypothetical protein n=1 Tax=Niallia taxi TaxID=2499688 RepID=UPI003F5E605B